jgi:vanillate O-demethylase ferredoxin subunit
MPLQTSAAVAQQVTPSVLQLRVAKVTAETGDICAIELVEPSGRPLPAFTAGAHVDLQLGDGLIRQYSLCNDPREEHRYELAILKEKASRGGSVAAHALCAGDIVAVSAPRNNFALAADAEFHLLLAGGIGVTPMMAMIAELQARNADFLLHYCTRSPEQTAFLARLEPLIARGKVVLHHDGGDPGRGLDLRATLSAYAPGRHAYVCGPSGFLSAAKVAAAAWPEHAVHFEHFSAVPISEEDATWDQKPFQVKVQSTGQILDVAAGQSIVSALRAAGLAVDTSCEDGFCGTCLTRYLAGEPVHRDAVLGDAERKSFVMICRARSRSPLLVLDL